MTTAVAGAYPRISARRGQVVDLNVDFLRNGTLTDPYAIRYIEIYRTQVAAANLVATIPVLDPEDELYPAPVLQELEDTELGDCCTEPTASTVAITGKFHLPYQIPTEFQVPDVYFDLWYYFADNPCEDGTGTACDLDSDDFESKLLRCCHRFWVYPEDWYCDDRLQSIRFAFEPLDQNFNAPEIRPLEVGIIPMPLYDYNYNLVTSMIPYLNATITIETRHKELLVDNSACDIAIRQGSYRSHPWVVRYMVDTSMFLKGTYQYYITLSLPDGSTRVSRKFNMTVS